MQNDSMHVYAQKLKEKKKQSYNFVVPRYWIGFMKVNKSHVRFEESMLKLNLKVSIIFQGGF